MDKNLKAFVLMPFEPEFDSLFLKLLKPTLEEIDYEVKRADSFLDQKNILHDIVNSIETADLIIAELTNQNPNVLYELGLCHGLNKPTVLIAQSIDDVPFDLRAYRILIYSTHFDEIINLTEKLTEICLGHKSNKIIFGNPLTDFMSKKGNIAQDVAISSNIDVKETQEEEKELYDLLLGKDNFIEKMTNSMEVITSSTSDIAQKLDFHTTQLVKNQVNVNWGNSKKIYNILLNSAKDISEYATKLEGATPDLEFSMNELEEFSFGFIQLHNDSTPENFEQLNIYKSNVASLLDVILSTLPRLKSFQASVSKTMGYSKDISKANRRVIKSLENIILIFEKAEAFCTKIISVIDEKIGN